MKESAEMLKEAERTGAVKIMIPVSELKFMLLQSGKVEEMQKALEWYAGEQYGTVMFYPPIPDIPILHDCGDRARQALKGDETK